MFTNLIIVQRRGFISDAYVLDRVNFHISKERVNFLYKGNCCGPIIFTVLKKHLPLSSKSILYRASEEIIAEKLKRSKEKYSCIITSLESSNKKSALANSMGVLNK